MHIYSEADLFGKFVQDEASEAFLNKNIGEESYKKIMATYPSDLYTPNYFIRIALGIFTMVAIIFSALLMLLIIRPGPSFTAFCFTLAVIYFVGLELFVRRKKYYNAGIDNLLIFFSAAFLVNGMDEFLGAGNITMSFIAMLVCLCLSIRFVDAFMAVLSFLALLVFVFFSYTGFGTFAIVTAPYLLMIVSAVVFFFAKKSLINNTYLFYQHALKSVSQISLLTFYAAGNYGAITKTAYRMFPYDFAARSPIPFDWIFWVFTFIIPIAYVGYGIAKKELMFIRAGLVLVAVSVFTFRNYYHIIAVEVAMLTAGAALIAISYFLITYLKTAKAGFSMDKETRANKERLDMKSLILAQVSGKHATTNSGVEFGGGSFGGGGGGSSY